MEGNYYRQINCEKQHAYLFAITSMPNLSLAFVCWFCAADGQTKNAYMCWRSRILCVTKREKQNNLKFHVYKCLNSYRAKDKTFTLYYGDLKRMSEVLKH